MAESIAVTDVQGVIFYPRAGRTHCSKIGTDLPVLQDSSDIAIDFGRCDLRILRAQILYEVPPQLLRLNQIPGGLGLLTGHWAAPHVTSNTESELSPKSERSTASGSPFLRLSFQRSLLVNPTSIVWSS